MGSAGSKIQIFDVGRIGSLVAKSIKSWAGSWHKGLQLLSYII